MNTIDEIIKEVEDKEKELRVFFDSINDKLVSINKLDVNISIEMCNAVGATAVVCKMLSETKQQMARFTRQEFSSAYNQVDLICEKYPEVTKGKAKMFVDENLSTETDAKKYNRTISYIEDYLK